MKVSDIEIPFEKDRNAVYRLFEMLPAILSYGVFIFPFVLSFFSPNLAAYFLILYVLIWFARAMAISFRVVQGYGRVKQTRKLDWEGLLSDIDQADKQQYSYEEDRNSMLRVHGHNLQHIVKRGELEQPRVNQIVHAVMIATYNETQDIIHPTVEHIIKSKGIDTQTNVAFFLAYENRTGDWKTKESHQTVKKYSEHFMYSEAVGHDLQPDEIIGKGGNATWCARRINQWAEEVGIDPSHVVVTVLDADNRPDENYLAALTYAYIVADDRKYKSYQPIAMYTNNIWDVPALMRVSAVNNSFFHTANAMRFHMIRNFSAHAQSLDALIEADYWSVRTVVEDGHQFWRMYFRYDGKHDVVPLFTPIYQDAVLASTYKKTMIAQFKQIQRWTYGASDIAYVATRAFFLPNKVPKMDVFFKFMRLVENHVTWASSSLLLIVAAWVPLLISSSPDDSIVALQLPSVMSKINLAGVIVVLMAMYIGFATLPPKPKHYRHTRTVAFALQWFLVPVVGIVFNSFAAYYSQTRLLLKRYVGAFHVTEKAVKKVKT